MYNPQYGPPNFMQQGGGAPPPGDQAGWDALRALGMMGEEMPMEAPADYSPAPPPPVAEAPAVPWWQHPMPDLSAPYRARDQILEDIVRGIQGMAAGGGAGGYSPYTGQGYEWGGSDDPLRGSGLHPSGAWGTPAPYRPKSWPEGGAPAIDPIGAADYARWLQDQYAPKPPVGGPVREESTQYYPGQMADKRGGFYWPGGSENPAYPG